MAGKHLLALVLVGTSAGVLGDTTNATYQAAKAALNNGNCISALPLLAKYEKEDEAYLERQPLFFAQIKEAEAYCLRQRDVVASMIKTAPSPASDAATDDFLDRFRLKGDRGPSPIDLYLRGTVK